ncbi:hypothetical protein [Haladaptatus sp. NG-WS-4]
MFSSVVGREVEEATGAVVSSPSLVETDVVDDVDGSRDAVVCVVELCSVVAGVVVDVVIVVVGVVVVSDVVVLVGGEVVRVGGGVVVLVVEPESHGSGLSLETVESNVSTLTLRISSPAYCPSP